MRPVFSASPSPVLTLPERLIPLSQSLFRNRLKARTQPMQRGTASAMHTCATPSSDPEKFAALQEGGKVQCPDMSVQLSTGGRSGAGEACGGMLSLRSDMAIMSVVSNNFATRDYENPPQLVDWLASEMVKYDVKPDIEAFDLSHSHKAAEMNRGGRIPRRLYIQFVMGVSNAMLAGREVFDLYIKTVNPLAPDTL